MPEMSGVEFLSRVKDLYPKTVRIVLSGYSELSTVTDAINNGAIWKYITKPWDDEALIQEIRSRIPLATRRMNAAHPDPTPAIVDTRQRPLHDLRISVTDRCNFRCVYCMPKTVFGRDYPFLPRNEILSYEEIVRLARLFAAQGVHKIRLTGGEPLMRQDIERLIEQLAHDSGPRTDADHQRLGCWPSARAACATPACTASRSASTRSTTRSSGA